MDLVTRRDPEAAEQPLAVVETHVSTLFFLGDRVYKRKRPVSFPFLDFSTCAHREEACLKEVELNRRLAPDVYLGVSTILGFDGAPCDHLVVMKRLPPERSLASLLEREQDAGEHLRRIARILVSFHERADNSGEIAREGTRDAVLGTWERNFAEMRRFVGPVLPQKGFDLVVRLARAYVMSHEPLFTARVAAGRVRDGHGDLQAADIFCMDDGPRILDCIEFDDRLRYADVVDDIAFLAMDLERLGHPELAARFVRWYREFSGDSFPDSLLDHYVAYRALVRCKVACIRAEQGSPESAAETRRLLRLARAHLVRARPIVVLIGGLPGTGKSTLAMGLADARGWLVLRSDEVRKDLAGLAHERGHGDAFGAGVYSPAMTDATYEELLARAEHAVAMGENVILDASWRDARLREAARRMVASTHSDLVQLRCVTRDDIAELRLAERSNADPSDATIDIARRMTSAFDPWFDARDVDTAGPQQDVLESAIAMLDVLDARYSMSDAVQGLPERSRLERKRVG